MLVVTLQPPQNVRLDVAAGVCHPFNAFYKGIVSEDSRGDLNDSTHPTSVGHNASNIGTRVALATASLLLVSCLITDAGPCKRVTKRLCMLPDVRVTVWRMMLCVGLGQEHAGFVLHLTAVLPAMHRR